MIEHKKVGKKGENCKVSTDKKLALVRTVRMQNQYNRNLCKERERLIYGLQDARGEVYAAENTISLKNYSVMNKEFGEEEGASVNAYGGFRIRFFLAAILFFLFVFWDRNQIQIMETGSNDFCKMIAESSDLVTEVFSKWNGIDL